MKQYLRPMIRVIDVNFNRAREALRTIEDYTRFVLSSKSLTQALRQLRHNLTQLLKELPFRAHLISARDVTRDIGRSVSVRRYRVISDVIIANFKRLEESLRVLTEYLKTAYSRTAAKLERLRFVVYELEESLTQILQPKKSLEQSRLYVLISRNLTCHSPLKLTRTVIKGGADVIQLREKSLSTHKFLSLAFKIREITVKQRVLFIINDRVDLAVSCQADGVHLGQEDMSIRQARRILGPDKIIGATSHNFKEALEAERQGADYISVGPMFPSPTKQVLPAQGFKYLTKVVQRINIPYFAIGGIDERSLPQLLKRHNTSRKNPLRIAVSSAVIAKPEPATATRRIKKILAKSLTT